MDPSTSSSATKTIPLPDIIPELRIGDVWLEDGNIILAAQGVSFRVHRSVLSRHSEVFQDMFSFPQPERNSPSPTLYDPEKLQGCPIVQLSDSPRELSHFLSALYDGRSYFSRDCALEFDAIIALIRLGTKYQATSLRKEGLHRLKIIKALITNEDAALTSLSDYRRDLASPWKKENSITLVNLAESLDLEKFLPLALYGCCQLDDALIDGITHQDGSLETLSRPNLKRCLAARNQLAITQIRIMSDAHFCLALATNVCERKASPADGCLVKTMRIPSLPQMPNIAIWHPLRRLDMWWSGMSGIDLCHPCAAAVTAFHQNQQDKIFSELPKIFGLL